MSSTHFHALKVSDIKQETPDTVSVAFDIPADLKDIYKYEHGQNITVKFIIDGKDERRSYSLCTSPEVDNDFRIAIKKVPGGKVSSYMNDSLKVGDAIETLPPTGSFHTKLDATNNNNYVAFAAGSGITPIISIIKSTLTVESNSKFTLFYGNKSSETIIFKDELAALENKFEGRLKVMHVLSRENSSDPLFEGRITKYKAEDLLAKFVPNLTNSHYFLCGPEEMISNVSHYLESKGVPDANIHFELFTVPVKSHETKVAAPAGSFSGTSKVKVIMDDEEFEFELNTNGDSILDAAMDAGVDAPFSCKGAVCCTCKGKVVSGSATMEMNYALSDAEVEEGYILTCQAHPSSEELTVDYDVI